MTERLHCDRPKPQRRVCILDPMLAFSRYGLMLVKHLGTVLELWVGREFWHLLDAAELYSQRPELLLPQHFVAYYSPEVVQAATQEIRMAIATWKQARFAGPMPLFWFGDRPWESVLPTPIHANLFWQWEALARSLDGQFQHGTVPDLATLAFRDAIALAAVLESAFILTYQPANAEIFEPPEICHSLDCWQIPYQLLPSHNAAVAAEQDWLSHLLMQQGLAKLLWANVHLSVLHLLLPSAQAIQAQIQPVQAANIQVTNLDSESYSSHTFEADLWQGSQGFWYSMP